MNVNKKEDSAAFLNDVGVQQIIDMLNIMPNILFWIKDRDSRIVYANTAFLEQYDYKHIEHVLGKTDLSFTPYFLARQYLIDDDRVISGESIDQRLEMNMLKNGQYGWFSTYKRPLRNAAQDIIGSYGFTQHLNETSPLLAAVNDIKTATDYIHQHYFGSITVAKLAEISFLSISALERRFKKQLSKTPKQFINQVRLENARRMIIESHRPISDIAEACGFAEHSYFSKQFKALFAISPSRLRQQIQQTHDLTRKYYNLIDID